MVPATGALTGERKSGPAGLMPADPEQRQEAPGTEHGGDQQEPV